MKKKKKKIPIDDGLARIKFPFRILDTHTHDRLRTAATGLASRHSSIDFDCFLFRVDDEDDAVTQVRRVF